MKETIQTLNQQFEENKLEILNDLFEYLKIKSISSNPEFKEDVLECSKWVTQFLAGLGLSVETWSEGSGHPCLFAERIVSDAAPTVLFYGHYDVQPIEPIELWKSDPFEPEIRDGKIFARGAQDNKGQSFYVMQAIKSLKKLNALPKNLNLKFLFEGEEECGSKSLPTLIDKNKDKLSCDYLYVVDMGMHTMEKPAVTLGCRGVVSMTVQLTASNTDLHSGEHGGISYNPLHALVEILAETRCKETGKITIPGFYDNIKTISDDERKDFDFELDSEFYFQMFGAKMSGGEKEYSALESAWLRPTLEINGIAGGYAGNGFKTVIPATATAKVSCRLVPDQDPKDIAKKVVAFLTEKCPDGVQIEVTDISTVGQPFRNSGNTKLAKLTREVISVVTGKKCLNIMAGGSIPIISKLATTLNADTLMIGYGLPEDNLHAPNENFGVDRIKLGHATIGALINALDEK